MHVQFGVRGWLFAEDVAGLFPRLLILHLAQESMGTHCGPPWEWSAGSVASLWRSVLRAGVFNSFDVAIGFCRRPSSEENRQVRKCITQLAERVDTMCSQNSASKQPEAVPAPNPPGFGLQESCIENTERELQDAWVCQ